MPTIRTFHVKSDIVHSVFYNFREVQLFAGLSEWTEWIVPVVPVNRRKNKNRGVLFEPIRRAPASIGQPLGQPYERPSTDGKVRYVLRNLISYVLAITFVFRGWICKEKAGLG